MQQKQFNRFRFPVRLRTFFQKSILLLLLGLLLIFSGYHRSLDKADYQDHFVKPTQQLIQETIHTINEKYSKNVALAGLIKNLYYEYNYKPIWTFETELTEDANTLIELLEHVEQYGLYAKDFNTKKINRLAKRLEKSTDKDKIAKHRTSFEVTLTQSCFVFMAQLNKGFRYNEELLTDSLKLRFVETLTLALNDNFKERILSVQPNFIEYKRLQNALEKFVSTIEVSNQRNNIPNPKEFPDSSKAMATSVLIKLGFMADNQILTDSIYKAALINYQSTNSLKPNGVLTKQTISKLNRSTHELYSQIAYNLDKYRSAQYKEHCIFVNIPEYKLKMVNGNQVTKEYNVVVGKTRNQTPEITSSVDKVVVNPFWTVPKKIAIYELVPRIKKDSTFLTRNRFEVIDKYKNVIDQSTIDWEMVTYDNFEYVLRQKSFSANALGKIKFLFPNKYSVYVHDTPSKRSFKNHYRAYSHGCVRIENPFNFAVDFMSLVKQEDSTTQTQLKSNKREEITIESPLDIYIQYYTCSADENLNIYFHDDIYKKFDDYKIMAN